MEETNKKDIEQSAWNLSQNILIQIGYLIQKASNSWRNGLLQSSFFDTKEITMLIYNDLSKEEDKQLSQLEREICLWNNKWKNFKKVTEHRTMLGKWRNEKIADQQAKEMNETRNMYAAKITIYRKFVMTLLGKYGYGTSKKQDSARMF